MYYALDSGSREATAWIPMKGIEELPVLTDEFVAQSDQYPLDTSSNAAASAPDTGSRRAITGRSDVALLLNLWVMWGMFGQVARSYPRMWSMLVMSCAPASVGCLWSAETSPRSWGSSASRRQRCSSPLTRLW